MKLEKGRWLNGIAISPGLALGKTYVYQDILLLEQGYYNIDREQVDKEHQRITDAFDSVTMDLKEAMERAEEELDSDFSAIFRVQSEILKDEELHKDIVKELEKELVNAELAVKNVFRRFENKLRSAKYALMAQRGDDVADLARRVLRELKGIRAHSLENLPQGTVLVAHRLLPSDTVFLSSNSVAAAIVEAGGPASHTAIIAREMGIPAVSEVSEIVKGMEQEMLVLVDGLHGRILIDPDNETRSRFLSRMAEQRQIFKRAQSACREQARSKDGELVQVFSNIGSRSDALLATENGAEGVGLYRLEKLFLARKTLPTKDELSASLDATLRALEGLEVTLRLLDVGGDKELPSIDNPDDEANPALGQRGIRLLLAYEDLLDTQVRSILELSSQYRLRMMAPMVSLPEDMAALRKRVDAIAEELSIEAPPLGAMIETPSAALRISEIAHYADFFSFGTNDLTQYTMAAGRENHNVVEYFDESNPAVLRLMRIALADLSQSGFADHDCEICGELASRRDSLEKVLDMGLRKLSVAPLAVPMVKEAVRQIDLSAPAC